MEKGTQRITKTGTYYFLVSDIQQWLTTFKPLLDTPFKRYKFYKNHAAFQSSYYHLTALVGYFSNKDACQEALSVWDDLDATHEFSVIKWLITYSDLNRCFALFEKQVLPFFNPETQQLQLKIPMHICLSGNDWNVLLQFFQTYQKQYKAYYALYQQKVRSLCPDFCAKTKPSLAELVAKLNINTATLVYRKRLKKNTFLYGNSDGFDPMEPGVSFDSNTYSKTIHPENGSGSFEIVELE
ncbi:hypothetical protein [Flavobacterium sp.]|uniref:hypothetical protein n=1 Tax=Flavobacterium sp. TaxID=239 RepID=UPI002625A051|nr:hypothetical protein [Flavobacterium sp.]